MYNSSSEDEQFAEDNQNNAETRRRSRVRPRQSVQPPQPQAGTKTRKVFYTDEHPEVPKVRRASRNKEQSEPSELPELEAQERTETQKRKTTRRPPATPKQHQPLSHADEDDEVSTRQIRPTRRPYASPRGSQSSLPSTEQDEDDETSTRQTRSTRHPYSAPKSERPVSSSGSRVRDDETSTRRGRPTRHSSSPTRRERGSEARNSPQERDPDDKTTRRLPVPGRQARSSTSSARKEYLDDLSLADRPTTRMNRPRQQNQEMDPFTGLEEGIEDAETADLSEAAAETRISRPRASYVSRQQQTNYRSSVERASTKVSAHSPGHGSRYSRTNHIFYGRRQTWIILAVLALVVLVGAPLLVNLIHSVSTARQVGVGNSPTQNGGAITIPGGQSNAHEITIIPPQTDHPAPPVYATASYLLDANTGDTLYAHNPFLHLPMLSTTKMMTAALAVEKGNLDQKITITPAMEHDIKQLSADSALFGVKQGETYSLRDLLYGLLYLSGNDAALVIADALGGSVPNFVAMMNQKALSMGLHDTHFVNPHGLLSSGQYSSAHDLALLGEYALGLSAIQQISSGKVYHMAAGGHHDARILLNENQFLWWYPGVDGGKTGFDGISDFIQVISVTRDKHRLVGVVIHTNDWWTDMRDLMNYGFNTYTWISPHDVDAAGQPIPYDTLWNYFDKDTKDRTIATANQGRYYIYTGYSVSGPIMSYFDAQGGLKKFGYPTKAAVPAGGPLMNQQFQHGQIQCDFTTNKCRTL